MFKKIFVVLILVFSVLLISGTVFGAEVKHSDSSYKSSISSKSIKISPNPIKNISTTKSTFKAGNKIKIKVTTTKSVKNVYTRISGKGTYKLKKSNNNVWYYNLRTKGYKTGKYNIIIKATTYKNNIYKKNKYFKVDNIPPKLYSLKSNVKSIKAGNPFHIEVITDKTSKKVIAKVRGKIIYFKSNSIYKNNTQGYNNHNAMNWTFNGKISYKEIGNLNITVYAYDSIGNIVKKSLYIKSIPVYVRWNGTVLMNNPTKIYYYSNPINSYQKSINVLSKYVKVYEGYAGSNYILGITYNNGYKATKVIIAYKDPFVVYHELGHVLNWKWSEYQCDLYAYKKVGYWLD